MTPTPTPSDAYKFHLFVSKGGKVGGETPIEKIAKLERENVILMKALERIYVLTFGEPPAARSALGEG